MNKLIDLYSDEDLFKLVQQGDHLAFTMLYNRYKKPLLHYAIKKIGKQEAPDIVQDIFVKIWSNRETISFQSKFSWYLFHMTKNRLIDSMIKSKNSDKYLKSLNIKDLDNTDCLTDFKIREDSFKIEIDQVLKKYGGHAQKIIDLKMEGYNNHEIANQLNLNEKTVRNQKSKIIKFLKSNFLKTFFYYILILEIIKNIISI